MPKVLAAYSSVLNLSTVKRLWKDLEEKIAKNIVIIDTMKFLKCKLCVTVLIKKNI